MRDTKEVVDEYTLAAYLAGTLPPDQREAVSAYIASNPDVREVFCMAFEAYEAASVTPVSIERRPVKQTSYSHAPDRGAMGGVSRHWGKVTTYLAAACVVLTMGAGLRLVLGPPGDALRSIPMMAEAELHVQVHAQRLVFQWTAITGVDHYRVVVYDEEGSVVAQHTTPNTRIEESDAFVTTLRETLSAGQSYAVRVAAFDSQNRRIQDSYLVDFTR